MTNTQPPQAGQDATPTQDAKRQLRQFLFDVERGDIYLEDLPSDLFEKMRRTFLAPTRPTSPATDELADVIEPPNAEQSQWPESTRNYVHALEIAVAVLSSPPAPSEDVVYRRMDNYGFSKEFVEAHTPPALDPYTLEQAAKIAEKHSNLMDAPNHMDSAKMIGQKLRALIPTSEGVK